MHNKVLLSTQQFVNFQEGVCSYTLTTLFRNPRFPSHAYSIFLSHSPTPHTKQPSSHTVIDCALKSTQVHNEASENKVKGREGKGCGGIIWASGGLANMG